MIATSSRFGNLLLVLCIASGVQVFARPWTGETQVDGDDPSAKYEVYVPDEKGQLSHQLMSLPEIRTLLARQSNEGEAFYNDKSEILSLEGGKGILPGRSVEADPSAVSDVISSVKTIVASEMAQQEGEKETKDQDEVFVVMASESSPVPESAFTVPKEENAENDAGQIPINTAKQIPENEPQVEATEEKQPVPLEVEEKVEEILFNNEETAKDSVAVETQIPEEVKVSEDAVEITEDPTEQDASVTVPEPTNLLYDVNGEYARFESGSSDEEQDLETEVNSSEQSEDTTEIESRTDESPQEHDDSSEVEDSEAGIKPVSYQNVLGDDHDHHHHHEHEHHSSNPAVFGPVPLDNAGLTVTSASQDAELKEMSCSSNKIAWKVWNNAVKERSVESNEVFSPLALTSALGIAFLGAKGRTAQTIDSALGLEAIAARNPHLHLQQVARDLDNSEYFNSLYSHTVYLNESKGSLMDIYRARIDTLYGANVATSQDEVYKTVQKSVKEASNSHMDALLNEKDMSLRSPFGILSTAYLNVAWPNSIPTNEEEEEFLQFLNLPSAAQVSSRRLVAVPTVRTSGTFYAGYDPILDATAVALPLYPAQNGREEQYFSFAPNSSTVEALDDAGHLSLVLVMPGSSSNFEAGGKGLAGLESRLAQQPDGWNSLMEHMIPRRLDVRFPQLARQSSLQLGRSIMGVQFDDSNKLADLFDPDVADFGGVANYKPLYLLDIAQLVELNITSVATQISDDDELSVTSRSDKRAESTTSKSGNKQKNNATKTKPSTTKTSTKPKTQAPKPAEKKPPTQSKSKPANQAAAAKKPQGSKTSPNNRPAGSNKQSSKPTNQKPASGSKVSSTSTKKTNSGSKPVSNQPAKTSKPASQAAQQTKTKVTPKQPTNTTVAAKAKPSTTTNKKVATSSKPKPAPIAANKRPSTSNKPGITATATRPKNAPKNPQSGQRQQTTTTKIPTTAAKKQQNTGAAKRPQTAQTATAKKPSNKQQTMTAKKPNNNKPQTTTARKPDNNKQQTTTAKKPNNNKSQTAVTQQNQQNKKTNTPTTNKKQPTTTTNNKPKTQSKPQVAAAAPSKVQAKNSTVAKSPSADKKNTPKVSAPSKSATQNATSANQKAKPAPPKPNNKNNNNKRTPPKQNPSQPASNKNNAKSPSNDKKKSGRISDDEVQTLDINRAFLYAIRHNPTGLLMMIGRYVQP